MAPSNALNTIIINNKSFFLATPVCKAMMCGREDKRFSL